MFEILWEMDEYKVYIWPSYFLTLFCLSFLYIRSIHKFEKAKRMLNQLTKKNI